MRAFFFALLVAAVWCSFAGRAGADDPPHDGVPPFIYLDEDQTYTDDSFAGDVTHIVGWHRVLADNGVDFTYEPVSPKLVFNDCMIAGPGIPAEFYVYHASDVTMNRNTVGNSAPGAAIDVKDSSKLLVDRGTLYSVFTHDEGEATIKNATIQSEFRNLTAGTASTLDKVNMHSAEARVANGASITITGESDIQELLAQAGKIDMTGGTVSLFAQAESGRFGVGDINLDGTDVVGGLEALGGSITMTGGTAGAVVIGATNDQTGTGDKGGSVSLTNTTVDGGVNVRTTGTFSITDGTIGSLLVAGDSFSRLKTTTVNFATFAVDSAILQFDGGTVQSVSSSGHSFVSFVTNAIVNGPLSVHDASTMDVGSGVTVLNQLLISGDSDTGQVATVRLNNAQVTGPVTMSENSIFIMSGGAQLVSFRCKMGTAWPTFKAEQFFPACRRGGIRMCLLAGQSLARGALP